MNPCLILMSSKQIDCTASVIFTIFCKENVENVMPGGESVIMFFWYILCRLNRMLLSGNDLKNFINIEEGNLISGTTSTCTVF